MTKKPKAGAPEKIDITDLIRPNDFKSMEILTTVKNTTTGGELRRQGAVQIVEFLEKGMILEAPSRFAKKTQYLVLTFEIDSPALTEKWKFNTGAKVDSAEPSGEGRETLAVSLIQFDPYEWSKFQALFGNRQAEIEAYLKSARGES